MTTLDPRSRAAARGWSDLAIRNLFIIPTIALPDRLQHLPADLFARLFVHRLPRVGQRSRPSFVGLQNYRDLLNDPYIWTNFTVTAKYVIVSVAGQMLVGFGLALLLNRSIPAQGAASRRCCCCR